MCVQCVITGKGPDLGELLPVSSIPGQYEELRDAGMDDAGIAVTEAVLEALAKAGRGRRS